MRIIGLAFALALIATSAAAQITPAPAPPAGPNPFQANVGSAPRPPAETTRAARPAPPEGRAPAGIDFGQWRGANAGVYGPAFEAQMTTRYAGMSRPDARADLERNGFVCAQRPGAIDCRIEITDNGCAKDWYVALDDRRTRPYAGFDVICDRPL